MLSVVIKLCMQYCYVSCPCDVIIDGDGLTDCRRISRLNAGTYHHTEEVAVCQAAWSSSLLVKRQWRFVAWRWPCVTFSDRPISKQVSETSVPLTSMTGRWGPRLRCVWPCFTLYRAVVRSLALFGSRCWTYLTALVCMLICWEYS